MDNDLSFATLVPIYLDACSAEGKSPATLVAYRESLSLYLRMAEAEDLPLRVDEVTPPDVYRFIAAVRRRGVGDATQHRRHREVQHFYSWLKRMEVVLENPFQKVPLIRLEQKIVEPFKPEQIATMVAACDLSTFTGSRDRAIILFLLDSGVRASELVGLNLDDISIDTGRARIIHGKGKKQRVVAFSPVVGNALDYYLEFRGLDPGPLFQAFQGAPLLTNALRLICYRLSRRTGIPKIHPHRFRHTFATMAIRAAAREIDVQHLLGHSNSAMVRRYTRTYDAEQAALAHGSFSPVGQVLGR